MVSFQSKFNAVFMGHPVLEYNEMILENIQILEHGVCEKGNIKFKEYKVIQE